MAEVQERHPAELNDEEWARKKQQWRDEGYVERTWQLRVTAPDGTEYFSGDLIYWQMPDEPTHSKVIPDLKFHAGLAVHYFERRTGESARKVS